MENWKIQRIKQLSEILYLLTSDSLDSEKEFYECVLRLLPKANHRTIADSVVRSQER